jgi:hypothetical protein
MNSAPPDASITINTHTPKEYRIPSELPGFIKAIIYSILGFLIVGEVVEFIKLRGFENPIGYCLFKLIVYTFFMLLIKSSDSAMLLVLNNLKELNETMCVRLEEIQSNQSRIRKQEESKS